MSDKSEDTHEIFLARLRESHRAVWFVAHALWKRGLIVRLHPATEAARFQDWKKHSDEGDLYISTDTISWSRVEVKRLSVEFSCQDDWPFNEDFIVDSRSTFDGKDPVPWAYLVLNKSMTHYGRVNVEETKPTWKIEERCDRWTDLVREYYLCPIGGVRFNSFEDLINGNT